MIWWLAFRAFAGGGPPNVMVVYNAAVPEAADVASHYADARSLPDGHTCGLTEIDPDLWEIPLGDYQSLIQSPVDACLAALPQPEEIDYLVLVRGLPYLVTVPNFKVSLSGALAVGHATNPAGDEVLTTGQAAGDPVAASVPNPFFVTGPCTALTIENGYYDGACVVAEFEALPISFSRSAAGPHFSYDFTDNLFIVTRLDGFDYGDAMDLVDRGAAADGTFPDTQITCMRAADGARGARDQDCEYAVDLLAADGQNASWLDTFEPDLAGHALAALFTGTTSLAGALDGNTWSPGAIGCNLTSYGAAPQNFFCNDDGSVCPESESQTSIARMVRAGATGVHGTAAEPLNNTFPNASALMLYSSGYNLGESFFLSQRFLYWQNIVLGDPLATPYGERPLVLVPSEVSGSLEITASHPDGVADIVLYIAGERVSEADGDTIVYDVDGEPGDTLEVLAVARTEIFKVQRTGWPVSEQRVRSRVQGWTAQTVTLVEVDAGDTDVSSDGDVVDAKGCGCETSSPGSGLSLALIALALRRRSRRGPPAQETGVAPQSS